MNPISDYLAAEHGHCDQAFIEAESTVDQGHWGQANTHLNQFCSSMQRHFEREEQVLFPAFEEATGQLAGPTTIMRMEHEQMRQMMHTLQQALADEHREKFLGGADTLLSLMQQHNLKEENMLYRMADQILSGQANQLLNDMHLLDNQI